MSKERKYYYCGPYWFPDWLKPMFSGYFNEQCMWHDVSYIKKEDSKSKADWLFFLDMLSKSKWNLLRGLQAVAYYGFVTFFGWASYAKEE